MTNNKNIALGVAGVVAGEAAYHLAYPKSVSANEGTHGDKSATNDGVNPEEVKLANTSIHSTNYDFEDTDHTTTSDDLGNALSNIEHENITHSGPEIYGGADSGNETVYGNNYDIQNDLGITDESLGIIDDMNTEY